MGNDERLVETHPEVQTDKRNLIPIIEGKLYTWAKFRASKEYPQAAISRVYQGIGDRVESPDRTSPQERWVIRRQAEIFEAQIIDAVLERVSGEHRRLVEIRYVESADWWAVAERLNVDRRTAYRLRDEVFAVLASDLGLYENGGAA